MARRFNPRLVGAFVLAATALGIAASVWLGSNRVFQRKVRFVVVFSQEIAGLEVDSPVKFRGVPVGRVASIHLSIGSPEAPLQELFMPVVIELNQSRIREMGETTDLGNPDVVQTLVRHGLRARLALESFLSGRRYVDLDIISDAPAPAPPPFPLPYPVIPVWVQPGLQALQSDAARVLGKLQALDLEGLIVDLRAAARGVGRASGRIDEAGQGIPRTLESMDRALAAIRDAARAVEKEVPTLAGDARASLQRLAAALDQMDATLREVKVSFAPGAPVPAQLERTLREVGQAARSLRVLTDSLERDPSQIVRGRPETQP
jgi:phospholipid/cholesterol/gamma-HCH transport system substrate-binding protein